MGERQVGVGVAVGRNGGGIDGMHGQTDNRNKLA